MKKINLKMYIIIILSLISTYAGLSLLWFNYNLEEMLYENDKIIYHFIIAIGTNLIFLLIAKCITKKNVDKIYSEAGSDKDSSSKINKKMEGNRRKFLIINSLTCFVMTIALYLYCHYNYLVLAKSKAFGKLAFDVTNILIAIVVTILALIPSTLLISSIFKNKNFNSNKKILKVLRIAKYVFAGICAVFMVAINIYFYLPLNEFKYQYADYEINNLDGYLICDYVFQDMRDCKTSKVTIPSKLWGKRVLGLIGVEFLTDVKEIELPSSLMISSFRDNAFYSHQKETLSILSDGPSCNFDIQMIGEPEEWFVKDNIIYDVDERKMYLFTSYKKDELYISDKIEGIFSLSMFSNSFIPIETKVVVSQDNPYFYEYGNVIWSKNSSSNICSIIPRCWNKRRI